VVGLSIDEHPFTTTQSASAVELRIGENEPAKAADGRVWIVLVPLGKWDESVDRRGCKHSLYLAMSLQDNIVQQRNLERMLGRRH
jgi:hypothetical protein